ncbi:MAG: hypothetical protein IPM58_16510 [Nitrospira sp.]|nr:hypothetical protein [Nitrospira sp.]
MYELFRICRNCSDKSDRFLKKVISIILPDANIERMIDPPQRASHWTDQEAKLEPLVDGNLTAVGTELFRKFRLIGGLRATRPTCWSIW